MQAARGDLENGAVRQGGTAEDPSAEQLLNVEAPKGADVAQTARGQQFQAFVSRTRVAVAVLALLAFAGVGYHLTQGHVRIQVDVTANQPLQLSTRLGQVACGTFDQNIAYILKHKPFDVKQGIANPPVCQNLCFEDHRCDVWTHRPDKQCSLGKLEQHEAPRRVTQQGVTSGGLPCNMDQLRDPGAIYCFAVMNPGSGERALLEFQHAQVPPVGIFACNENTIFSNQVLELAGGAIVTELVNTSLFAPAGGEFGTALNTDIFLRIWDKVFALGRWQNAEWTCKVDPDCVFLPGRLRNSLAHHPAPPNGVFLNNCKYGMHGPLEVFSKAAVGALQSAVAQCKIDLTAQCGGVECGWGEDMFIDQCCTKVLNVRRDDEWQELVEDHCPVAPNQVDPWNIQQCDTAHVAFHPFKDVESYRDCLAYTAVPPPPQPGPQPGAQTASGPPQGPAAASWSEFPLS